MSTARSSAPGARTAAVLAVVVVLALVAVLVGLVGTGGTGGSGGSGGSDDSGRSGAVSVAPRATARPGAGSSTSGRDAESGLRLVALRDLPREAQATVALIDEGGPFPYAKDGVTFSNNERVLPAHPRAWYREYTVRTPDESDRGPRRIVTGDDDRQIFYTGDHYRTFVRVAR